MVTFKTDREFQVLGMGEVMLRLSPEGKERISHCETFEKKAGGSELNVVSGISMLGPRTGIITKLPDNEIGKFVKHKIRYAGTSDDYITYDTSEKKRLGVYYYESGAYPRKSVVSYDRANSSFTTFSLSELPADVYGKTAVFHTSGITLGLCENIRTGVTEMMRRFKNTGTVISFDVNYRAALWTEAEAKEAIEKILPYVDLLFISEETLRKMFGMKGTLEEIHREFYRQNSGLKMIFSTKRRVISPQKHSFTSLVYDCADGRHYIEPEYEDIDVVDRIGSGDAYVAGALYGLLTYGSAEKAADYGDAMAALKNTVLGDMTVCDLGDIDRIIADHKSTGDKTEMVR